MLGSPPQLMRMKSGADAFGGGEWTSGDRIGRRFLVHEELPDAGLGNRMSALVSVFALALLSDRALLVNWCGACARTLRHDSIAEILVGSGAHLSLWAPGAWRMGVFGGGGG